MDKINNINFTGISNIGFINFKREPGARGSLSKSISMVLRDDLKGKDLSEYKMALHKVTDSPSDFYFHPESPHVLNVECYSDRNGDVLMLNGNVIEPENKTMPVFSYIAKLTRKIANMPEKDMSVNKDYVAYEAPTNLIYGSEINVRQSSPEQKSVFLNGFFNKDGVKYGAEQVNEFIQRIMNKYFDV